MLCFKYVVLIQIHNFFSIDDVEKMDSEDDDEVVHVKVNGKSIPITEVVTNPALAEAMTPAERVEYSRAYSELYDDEWTCIIRCNCIIICIINSCILDKATSLCIPLL